jgi:hypothetical protein
MNHPPSIAMLVWVQYNRGTLTKIAREAQVSPQFVHLVMRGARSSTAGRIEKLLRERGAPLHVDEVIPAA